jgi:hypothetical protein
VWACRQINSAVTAAGETVSTLWNEWDKDQQGVELYNVNVSYLGDTESSLGDAKSSLGDAESSLGDAESSLGDAESSLGDA